MKKLSIIVHEDGNIQVDNKDFEPYEFIGLLQSTLQHYQQKAHFESVLNYIETDSNFRNVLKKLITEETEQEENITE